MRVAPGPAGGARHLERMPAAPGPGDPAAVSGQPATPKAPTPPACRTRYPPFDITRAYRLRDTVPGAPKPVKTDGHGPAPHKNGQGPHPRLRRHRAR